MNIKELLVLCTLFMGSMVCAAGPAQAENSPEVPEPSGWMDLVCEEGSRLAGTSFRMFMAEGDQCIQPGDRDSIECGQSHVTLEDPGTVWVPKSRANCDIGCLGTIMQDGRDCVLLPLPENYRSNYAKNYNIWVGSPTAIKSHLDRTAGSKD